MELKMCYFNSEPHLMELMELKYEGLSPGLELMELKYITYSLSYVFLIMNVI